jgi:hypothetical protein
MIRYRDIVVPTSGWMLPSSEGDLLQNLSTHAAASSRSILAFMVVGANYIARVRTQVWNSVEQRVELEF